MGLRIKVKDWGRVQSLVLSGRFDFHANKAFRTAYDDLLKREGAECLEIDMRDVEYMDSSALGMLLLLKERAEAADRSVILAHCRKPVREILDVVNFGKLFQIR